MTPQEKAEELIISFDHDNGDAFTAVQEIIEAITNLDSDISIEAKALAYWEEVIYHIKNAR